MPPPSSPSSEWQIFPAGWCPSTCSSKRKAIHREPRCTPIAQLAPLQSRLECHRGVVACAQPTSIGAGSNHQGRTDECNSASVGLHSHVYNQCPGRQFLEQAEEMRGSPWAMQCKQVKKKKNVEIVFFSFEVVLPSVRAIYRAQN